MTDQEIIAYIRLLLGSIPPEVLPDETILAFLAIEKVKDNWPNPNSTTCDMWRVIYNTLVDVVRWLILQEVNSGEASITERLEKIGDETIQVKGGSTYQNWKDFLDWLQANPDYVNDCLSAVSSLVIIGGVRQDEFWRVKGDRNSRGPFDVGGIIPQTGVPGIPRRYPNRWPR